MIPWYLIVSGCLTIMLVLGRFISEKVRILYVNWIPEIVSHRYAYDVTETQKRTWRRDASWQLVFRAFQFSCLALWVCVEINWCQYFSFFLLYVEDVVHQEHKIPLSLIGGVLAQNTFCFLGLVNSESQSDNNFIKGGHYLFPSGTPQDSANTLLGPTFLHHMLYRARHEHSIGKG